MNEATTTLTRADAVQRPYVQISPRIRTGFPLIQLHIKNVGQSNATSLKLELDQSFYSNADPREERNLRTYTAFSQVIQSFAPQSELIFDLGTGPSIFTNSERCPLHFTVTATYEFDSSRFVESTTVDLQPFQLAMVPTDPVAEQIEKLTAVLSRLEANTRRAA